MSNRTISQVLGAGGPDPAALTTALSLIGFGDMCAAQRRVIDLSAGNKAIFKLSDFNYPPMRAGGVLKFGASDGAGLLNTASMSKGSFASDVPAAGLTVGSGNAKVRVIPKAGFTVKYAQFNPGGAADTGNYFLASQALAVYVTIRGSYAEIWVSLANSATAVANSTAALVKAAILANADAMSVLSTVDFNGGDGTGTATQSAYAGLAGFRPTVAPVLAAGVGVLPQAGYGSFVSSFDGNMIFCIDLVNGALAEYTAAPLLPPEENFYPGSA